MLPDDPMRKMQDEVPMLGTRFSFRHPPLYRFSDALQKAKERIGVWRIQAYYTPHIHLCGDNARRTPQMRLRWQRGYYYGVSGEQAFEGGNVREIHRCLAHLNAAWNADHELWWFVIAPKWELAAFQKTFILDAVED